MKRFRMITEADARVLEPGSTIALAAGGHITPLARDTLRSRRVSVVAEDGLSDDPSLAPAAAVRTVALAGDHTAVTLVAGLLRHLRGRGLAAHDLGAQTAHPVDYPDTAAAAARAVACGEADAGIVADGAGLGSAIAANKVAGIRAAMCQDATLARYAREHCGANVLALGASLVTLEQAIPIVEAFLATPMREPRYIRRLAKIRQLERRATE